MHANELRRLRIGVLGAGAMGSVFGARLFEIGEDITLIDVNDSHIDAIKADGLLLETDNGERRLMIPVSRAETVSNPFDLLLVFTKTYDTDAAMKSVRHLIHSTTCALTLQNGLGNGERIAGHMSPENILIGVTDWPAEFRAPGSVSSHGNGMIRLWSLIGNRGGLIMQITSLLNAAGFNCTADEQVLSAIWEKVTFNCAMNSIAAVTGYNVGEMADRSETRRLIALVVAEAIAVARASGVHVDSGRIRESIAYALANHREHKPSMLQDIEAGRPTEVDEINGAIVDAADCGGSGAPVIETLGLLVASKQVSAGPSRAEENQLLTAERVN